MQDESPILAMSTVIKVINRSASTIRRWEKKGLISPSRDTNNYRKFSINDIRQMNELIKIIKPGKNNDK